MNNNERLYTLMNEAKEVIKANDHERAFELLMEALPLLPIDELLRLVKVMQ